MKLSVVIEELEKEKGLDRTTLSSIICEGMLAAYAKKYPNLTLKAEYDKKTDEIEIFVQKTVVSTVKDDQEEITERRAKHVDKKAKKGDLVWLPFEGTIGRIEVLRARQVIANKIREIEAKAVYDEFKDKAGTIIYGVVHKCERQGILVKLQDVFAFLPKSLTSPSDKCVVGHPIRALLKEVLPQPKNESQLVLDRVSSSFLEKLFELEVPEVFEKLVEIKKTVRAPGYKSKILVHSHDKNIDPVGACVGVGGARIKPILKELGGERIDVISWGGSREELIRDSLKPAEIKRVELVDDNVANVWLDEDQRSLAIGKKGQNISLASKLAGVEVNLVEPPKMADIEISAKEAEPKRGGEGEGEKVAEKEAASEEKKGEEKESEKAKEE